MPMTLEQLTDQLSAIEPDEGIYEGIGPSEIPLLERLLRDEEPSIASRAVFALSRVSGSRAVRALSLAAADPRPEVRVSVAASVSSLRPSDGSDLLLTLLDDEDLGVRKFAIRAVSGTHDEAVHAKLRDLRTQDTASPIRELATKRLRELDLSVS